MKRRKDLYRKWRRSPKKVRFKSPIKPWDKVTLQVSADGGDKWNDNYIDVKCGADK